MGVQERTRYMDGIEGIYLSFDCIYLLLGWMGVIILLLFVLD